MKRPGHTQIAKVVAALSLAQITDITPLATDKLPGSSHEQRPSHLAGAVLELVDGDARDEQQQCFTLRGRKGEGAAGEAQGWVVRQGRSTSLQQGIGCLPATALQRGGAGAKRQGVSKRCSKGCSHTAAALRITNRMVSCRAHYVPDPAPCLPVWVTPPTPYGEPITPYTCPYLDDVEGASQDGAHEYCNGEDLEVPQHLGSGGLEEQLHCELEAIVDGIQALWECKHAIRGRHDSHQPQTGIHYQS